MNTRDKARFELWPLPDLRLNSKSDPIALDEPEEPDVGEIEFERGYQQGRDEGAREAEAMVASAMTALQSAYEELSNTRRKLAADNERAVHTLAVAVAQQIVQRELQTDPGVVQELVNKALDQVEDNGPTSVRINPADLTVLIENESDRTHVGNPIEWIPDTTLERGSCVVETPHRIVDGRIESVLKELFHRLNDV